jgi:alcohol dehydrogenase class IV
VDLIFALGGGSVIDLAKCLKAKFLLEGRSPELWVVPTTAGTGSEATPFATFFRGRSKQSLEDARILSDQVILDPLLLKGMHPRIAAPCALDALTQAIESLWSVRATDASRSFAMDAIALWLKSWKAALFNDEIAAWETMQIAAYRSGQAIAISRTTLAHALSYWLTAQKGVPHGLAVFLCLSPVILFNANEARAKNSILALERLFSVNSPQELVRKLQEILQAFGYHQDLRAYGVCVETEFIDFLRSAANNPRSGNNPRPIELGEIRKAFQRVGAYS